MTLPTSTLFWLVIPPLILVVVTVIWSLKHWDRTP